MKVFLKRLYYTEANLLGVLLVTQLIVNFTRMMKNIYGGTLALLLLGVVAVGTPNAAFAATTTPTSSLDAMLTQIKALMEQVATLQKQLSTIKGDVKSIIRDGVQEGMSGDDIKKLQELLATDSTIYPEGKVTGFFGPLTKQAIKRLQERHGHSATGEIDDETHDLLEEYLHEGFGDKIPQGLLRAPGIMKKVEGRLCDNRGHGKAMGPLCKKFRMSTTTDNGTDDNDNDSASTTSFKVTVTVVAGTTTVKFTSSSTDYTVVATSTNKNTVLAAVAAKLNVTVDNLDANLVKQVKDALAKALADAVVVTKAVAQTALNDAEDAINDAQDAIDATTGSTSAAEVLLEKAQDKLDAAQVKFNAKKYPAAKTLALEAIALAKDAEDAL
jgi:peptidoglycan hydrolase-like protein with peptidoglycan-binding domain